MLPELEAAMARLREHAPHLVTRQPWRYQGSVEADITAVLVALEDEQKARWPGGMGGPRAAIKARRERE